MQAIGREESGSIPAPGASRARHRAVATALALATLALCAAPGRAVPRTQEDYTSVPGPSGGDILSVSSVFGPPPGEFWFGARYAGRSDTLETYRRMEFSLQYGLHPRATVGVAALHQQQDMGLGPTGLPINKKGAGDTRVFLKWCAPLNHGSGLALGLRPSLRIPTGYDLEGDGLLSFTTGTTDFELLGLVSYETPRVGIYLNPGISLPGGRWHNELLGGLGAAVRGGLPLGLRAKAEYLARYDIPDDRFRHEAFAALEHDLFLGLAIDLGFRKALVRGEDPGAEFALGLSHGRQRGIPQFLIRPAAPRAHTRIAVPEISFNEPDAHGLGPGLREAMARELATGRDLTVSLEDRKAEYTAYVDVISLEERTGRSLTIPRVLATPRAELLILAQMTLVDQQGRKVVEGLPLSLRVTRGMGVRLFPASGNEDVWVPTADVRRALRQSSVRRLARQAADELARAMAADQAAQAAPPAQEQADRFGRSSLSRTRTPIEPRTR